jgi:hypothetical protein
MIIWQGMSNLAPFCLLCCGVPRWHRQPHHVGECSGVVISNFPDQCRDFSSKDWFTRDDLVKRSQGSFMIGHRGSIKDEPVAETSREPYSYPSARHRIRILLRCHRVVERPVQVAERNVNSHPGNREFRPAQFGHTR